ncbi:PfkB family carbohydrate kinase [Negadavirga shengliensis]|uniref:PfkB family carbohydrate kinase n=1 Tax=Negadavirga shengliensis TaxID=1389218 RepID=A0ABV9T1L2_9BACT
MIIVGGTYTEICFEPIWENIFGSGFRAVSLLLEKDNSEEVIFHTCADSEVRAHLNYYEKIYPNLSIQCTEIFKSPEFRYDHPLKTPSISPRPDLFSEVDIQLDVKGQNVLAFGLLEASFKIEAEKVVYDPQSPANPKTFTSTGSNANQLTYVVNYSEAKKIAGSDDLSVIKDFFFEKENCFALIIKMGAQGALLFESIKNPPTKIPVYRTNKVWPIGSGDVFSAYFALNWFEGQDLLKSANLASMATALYCNSKDLSIYNKLNSFSFPELIVQEVPNGQIYLAGPFFTFSERWLINEIWNILKGLGLKVFSPFHDVGHGKANDVVVKDLEGLDESEIVFAVIDGLDSGTLFEVGYAVSQGKKVIAFVQNEGEESLKMLEGSGCIIEKDLTTAIYKTYWSLETH